MELNNLVKICETGASNVSYKQIWADNQLAVDSIFSIFNELNNNNFLTNGGAFVAFFNLASAASELLSKKICNFNIKVRIRMLEILSQDIALNDSRDEYGDNGHTFSSAALGISAGLNDILLSLQ